MERHQVSQSFTEAAPCPPDFRAVVDDQEIARLLKAFDRIDEPELAERTEFID